ncbi:hypothetical protein QOT17_020015 [Balamuthia mandrillaris]
MGLMQRWLFVGMVVCLCTILGFLAGLATRPVNTAGGEGAAEQRRHAAGEMERPGGGRTVGFERRDELLKAKKLLWVSGLQDKTFDGSKSKFVETSDFYLRSYLVALLSAMGNAPSMLPLLVLQGDWSGRDSFLNRVRELGATVVFHKLSFEQQLRLQNGTAPHIDGMWGSLLKVDVHLIMDEVAPLFGTLPAFLPSHPICFYNEQFSVNLHKDPEEVDMDYVLWTDSDVIFQKDLNSISLPKPRLFSMAPDAGFNGVPENAGVFYLNVSAYASVSQELQAHANAKGWFYDVADQGVFLDFFEWGANGNFISPLPNTYNYRVYWGRPQPLFWSQALEPTIIHFHAVKPEFASCVVKKMRAMRATASERKQQEEEEGELIKRCGGQLNILRLAMWGFERDGGEYWDEVVAKYRSYVQRIGIVI